MKDGQVEGAALDPAEAEVAFVAGATGYTGREVVRALRDRGIVTHAHVRPGSPRLPAWRGRFAELGAEVDTTPWELEMMTRRLRAIAPTRVFFLIGTTRKQMKEEAKRVPGSAPANYENVDYGLASLLIKACDGAGLSSRFVYLSSLGVSERTRNAYLQARWKAEQELRESGLPFTIARPSFITGPDRDEFRPLERGGAAVADFFLVMAGRRMRARYGKISATELASALVRLALDPSFENRLVMSEELQLHR